MPGGAEDVRRLKQRWFESEPNLTTALERAFDVLGFTDQYVNACINSASAARAPRKDKVIKDSVWGMVEIDGASARLLDRLYVLHISVC
jgi:hypothetical protein